MAGRSGDMAHAVAQGPTGVIMRVVGLFLIVAEGFLVMGVVMVESECLFGLDGPSNGHEDLFEVLESWFVARVPSHNFPLKLVRESLRFYRLKLFWLCPIRRDDRTP